MVKVVGAYVIGSEMVTSSDRAEPPEIRGTTAESWYVAVAGGRKVIVGLRSEDEAVQRAHRRIREFGRVPAALVDGREVMIRRFERATFRGLDSEGNKVFALDADSDQVYAVTPCCQAGAKGSESGIVCRECYRPVPAHFGGPATVAVAAHAPWLELFPNGRFLNYEGDDPAAFRRMVIEEFEFDPADPTRPRQSSAPMAGWSGLFDVAIEHGWDVEHGWSFHCPAEHLDDLYGSGKYPLGS